MLAWLLIIILFVAIFMCLPVSFSIGLSSLVVLFAEPSPALTPWVLVQRLYYGLDSFTILAIPLFLMTAEIMNATGITDRLIRFCNVLVGHIRGGLAHVNVLVSMVFAGISGSSTADTAGIGKVLIPAMTKEGYSKEYSVVITAVSSTLGQIIPPSIIAVIYSATVGISVGAVFICGIIPGILIGVSQMALNAIYSHKHGYPREERVPFRKAIKELITTLPAVFTPIIIIGGIVGGLFTATEAAVIAASWALLLSLFYRTMTIKKFWKILKNTVEVSAATILCIGIATVFSYILAFYRVPETLGAWITSVCHSQSAFMLLAFLVFMIVGCFMDATPAIIMLAPVIAPIGLAIGCNPVHLGCIIVVTLALGLVTPPYGLCLLLACQIGETSLQKVMPTLLVFMCVMICIILLCALWPDALLWLPRWLMPNAAI
ncbi:MAG: TRAP transporter large permease [Clostridia bacterium]|nr:TRAP transporter large permease [Clostridia bacterium]